MLVLQRAMPAIDRNRVSDADVAVVMREYQAWGRLEDVPGRGHLLLRTDRATREIAGDVLALLDRRLLDLS